MITILPENFYEYTEASKLTEESVQWSTTSHPYLDKDHIFREYIYEWMDRKLKG